MIKACKNLTENAQILCCADFLWNSGRTLPHAILTIYLMASGCTLIQIATLQSAFMIVSTISEFPSGVIADVFSRKSLYLASILTLFISYFLIAFFRNNFLLLIVAYTLYGLSVSLKSGTLEAEVVIEYKKLNLDIQDYSIASSYVMTISSIIGGAIGSFFYERIGYFIYAISLILFICSFISALHCNFIGNRDTLRDKRISIASELKTGAAILRNSYTLTYVLILFAVSTLFLQPFFQYWQVLYQNNDIPVQYFGIMYVIFQICMLAGTAIYKRISLNTARIFILLCSIPLLLVLGSFFNYGSVVALPVVVVIFQIFYQHLDVIRKNEAPHRFISSFFSLVGTIENIASIVSLFIMACCIELHGIQIAYAISFAIFSALSMLFYGIHEKLHRRS